MTPVGRWAIAFWVAAAVWMSDRWVWPLPALLGVGLGVWISHLQRAHRRKRSAGLPPFELGTLLVIVGFLYVYVLYLLLGLGHSDKPAAFGLVLGLIILPLVLVGLVAWGTGKGKVPKWMARVWAQLVAER